MWRYAMRNRPAWLGTCPAGFIAQGPEIGRHGWIGYDRELTVAELTAYEMDAIVEGSNVHSPDVLDCTDRRNSWYFAYEYARDLIGEHPGILAEMDELGGDYKIAADVYRSRFMQTR